MYDLMFKATDKAAWDAFAETLPAADILIDEIGAIEGADGYHANVRTISDAVDCAALAQGYHYVQWIDPALVESPARIWAGGMNYYSY